MQEDNDLYEILNNIMAKYNGLELSGKSAKERVGTLNHCKNDKDKLIENPREFILAKDNSISDGRFFTKIGSAHIEGYLLTGKADCLYVFLHGARSGEIDNLEHPPRFLRNTYSNYVDGTILCLEDPMFYKYQKCKLGWYYGTPEEDYRLYCANIINRIAEILNIKSENIILFGSSGGGTAAIGIAYHLKGTTVVALNPQLNLAAYFRTPEIERETGLEIRDKKDKYSRNDNINLMLNNKETKFLIMCNVLSDHDFCIDLEYLCCATGHIPRYGISQKDNMFIWVYEAEGLPYEHSSFETPAVFYAIRTVCSCIKKGISADYFQGFCLLVNMFWREHYIAKKEAYLEKKNNDKRDQLISILNSRFAAAKKILFDIDHNNLILNSRDFASTFPGAGKWIIEDCGDSFSMAKIVIESNQWYELRLRLSPHLEQITGDLVFSLEILGDPEYIYVAIGVHNTKNNRRYSETPNIRLNNTDLSKIVEIQKGGWKKYSILIPFDYLNIKDSTINSAYSAQIKVLNTKYDNMDSKEFYFKKPKVEKGFWASDWTSAPEDNETLELKEKDE